MSILPTVQPVRMDLSKLIFLRRNILLKRKFNHILIYEYNEYTNNFRFRLVSDSECVSPAPEIPDSGSDVINIRQIQDKVCCPLRDVRTCDPDGFK